MDKLKTIHWKNCAQINILWQIIKPKVDIILVSQKIKEGNHMGKKYNIIKTATHLFATQGFDGTTTYSFYGSSEIIFRYSFSEKAWSVSVLTAPFDEIERIILVAVSTSGASTIITISYRPIVR